MKKLMIAFCLLFVSAVAVKAQDTTATQSQHAQHQQIQTSELPEAVRTSLEGQDYKGWTVSAAYKATMPVPNSTAGETQDVYMVDLRNGAQTKTVSFDKDGKPVEATKKDDQ